MKYGKVIDDIVCLFGHTDESGAWQGNIYYNDDGTRKTPDEVLQMFNGNGNPLKEIIVPSDFDGNTNHYNYIERDGKIILAGLKSEVIAEQQKQADLSRIKALKKALADSDYKVIKAAEYQLLGLDAPYDLEALQAERQAWREEINLLENKWRLK